MIVKIQLALFEKQHFSTYLSYSNIILPAPSLPLSTANSRHVMR
jgi:hypothetical protein